MATSSRHAGPATEGSRVVTVAKQIERSTLPSASAEGIGRSYPWASRNDILPWQAAPAITVMSYRAEARSVMMLYAVAYPRASLSTSDRESS
jgi:hypothetical protein